jgi:hypothetical protein
MALNEEQFASWVCCQALPFGLDVLDIPWKYWRAGAAHSEFKAESFIGLSKTLYGSMHLS